MLNLPKKALCCGCLACVDACVSDALEPSFSKDGFLYPSKHLEKCLECGKCESVCPVLHNYCVDGSFEIYPVAAWSRNESIRMNSSSGGVFAELAKYIIANAGKVIGAITIGLGVRHQLIETVQEIESLQGSKYLQSNTSGIYKKSLSLLKEGHTLLFSGTPCQVNALLKFVHKKKYKGKLYTCDLVCHGVPSYSLFIKYLNLYEKKTTKVLGFRDKKNGGPRLAMLLEFQDGKKMRSPYPQDPFLRCFALDLAMMKSCYNCRFAGLNRCSDLTLGDFWGSYSYTNEKSKGLSLVLVNTAKGEELLNSVQNVEHHKVSWKEALNLKNPRLYSGVNLMDKHPLRPFLPFALNLLTPEQLLKLYGNAAPRKFFWWWPYKVSLSIFMLLNRFIRRYYLKQAFNEIKKNEN